jgi:hypothetical protein
MQQPADDLVRNAIASQRDAALNALAFAHAEIAMLKAKLEEMRQKPEARDE